VHAVHYRNQGRVGTSAPVRIGRSGHAECSLRHDRRTHERRTRLPSMSTLDCIDDQVIFRILGVNYLLVYIDNAPAP
jgi:hypothetical protein